MKNKKLLSIVSVILLVICMSFTFCACSLLGFSIKDKDDNQAPQKLAAPKKLSVNSYNNFAEWTEVNEADSYEVVISVENEEKQRQITECNYAYLSFMSEYPTCAIKVRSVCKDNSNRNSDWTETVNEIPEEMVGVDLEKYKFRDAIMAAVWDNTETICLNYYIKQIESISDVHFDFSKKILSAVIGMKLQNNGFETLTCSFTYENLDKESDIINTLPISCSISAYRPNPRYDCAETLLSVAELGGKLGELKNDENAALEVIKNMPTSITYSEKNYSIVLYVKYKENDTVNYAVTSQLIQLPYVDSVTEDNYGVMITDPYTEIQETYFYECGALTAQFITDEIYFS